MGDKIPNKKENKKKKADAKDAKTKEKKKY
jgi:hypothetical protein